MECMSQTEPAMADQDPELQAIRAARLAQLQKQSGSSNASAVGPSDPDAADQRKEEDQMRRDLLATVLDSSARERCTYI